MKASLRALRNLLRALPAGKLLLPRKLAKSAGLLRPSRVAQRLRPGPVVDRLLPNTVTARLGGRPSEGDQAVERPHEADLRDAVADAHGLPLQHAVFVAVPVEIAYNQFTQFGDFPDFMRAVTKSEQIDPAQVEFEYRRWGLRRSWRAHIVDQRPEERIAWRSVSGVRLAGVTTFHSIAPRLTQVDASVVVEPAGAVQRIARRVGLLDRALAAELHRFKAFVEMREEETGAWRGYVADGEVVDEDDYFGWAPGEGAREESPAQGTDQASRSNGASADKSSGTGAGKADRSRAGGTRAGKKTGGSRTRA